MEILFLNRDEVKKVLTMQDCLKVVEDAFKFHAKKKVQMPPKLYLYFYKHNGDLRTMPAYLEYLDIAGVKIVNVHPDNPKKGLPSVMALMVLNSTETGAPLAVMDGTYITDIRTGAGGGIAVKYLARTDSKVIGIVGSGQQAKTQLLAIKEILDIERVMITSRTMKKCEQFKEELEPVVGCDIIPKESVESVCRCDILVTTTPVRSPIVKNEWISEVVHINAIGADAKGKQELDPKLLKRAKIVVDDIAQASHSGEINVPLSNGIISLQDIYGELGEIIAGIKKGREKDNEITIFDSTGLAVQDVATANLVYKKAIKIDLGRWLKLS
ncbi:MAG TPA: alanine dehydrogenase [Methanosarcinales archaeon]|nr:alanine dehydrogenase [Methanosarcinales archaeon]